MADFDFDRPLNVILPELLARLQAAEQGSVTPTPAPTLGNLLASVSTGTVGTALSFTISGNTVGSTLSLIGTGAAGLSINGTTVSGTPTTVGTIGVRETLAGATNSPKDNTGLVTIAAATLTIFNALASITPSTSAGLKIADVGGVPPGVTPTISPADGRFVIAGSQPAGWTIVRGMTAVSAGTVSIAIAATGATGASFSLTIVNDVVTLQPNPLPATPAPTTLSSPYSLAPTQVGRLSYWDFTHASGSTTIPAPLMLGRNAAGTKGVGIGSVNSDHISLYVVDSTGAVVRSPQYYIFSTWTPTPGRTYRLEFRAPPANSAATEHVMRLYDKADPNTIIIGYEYQYLKAFYDPADCSYMSTASGATSSALSALQYGPLAGSTLPLEVVTDSEVWAVNGSNLELTATLKYFKDTAPSGYTVKFGSGQPIAMTLQPSSSKGSAVVKAVVPKPAPGTPLVATYSDADASVSANGKQYIVPNAVMFGINLQLEGDFYHNQISNQKIGSWRSHFSGGNYNLRPWTSANPQMDQNGQPTQAAMQQIAADNAANGVIASGPNANGSNTGDGFGGCAALSIVAGRKVGQRNRVIWDGPQSMATFGDLYQLAKNVTTGTNGTQSWIDFDHFFDPVLFAKRDPAPVQSFDANTARIGFKLVNGVGPSNVKVYEIVSQANTSPRSSGDFDADYLTDCVVYRGHALYPFRTMDVQNIIVQYNRVWSAADVSTTMGPQFGQFAWSYPRCLAFFEAVGAGGQICYPLQADETFVRKVANMCAVWSARTKLHIAHELSNEPWNSGQPTYGKLVELGRAAGDTNSDAAGVARKQHAKMSTQMMKWITDEYSKVSGASQYMHRVINIQNATTGNTGSYASYDADFLTYHDEYQGAPYLAGGMANAYPTAYADITEAHLDDFINKVETVEIPKVYGWAVTNRDYAKSVNKRFACYEGLFEDIGNAAFQRKLKNDPTRWPYLINLLLSKWESMVGGMFRGYIDNGFAYGYRAHVSQSPDAVVDGAYQAIGWKTVKDYIASKPTI